MVEGKHSKIYCNKYISELIKIDKTIYKFIKHLVIQFFRLYKCIKFKYNLILNQSTQSIFLILIYFYITIIFINFYNFFKLILGLEIVQKQEEM